MHKPSKLSNLFWILSGCIIGTAVFAEMLGMKIFSLGKLLGLNSFAVSGLTFDFSMSVGILIWPFVFVISDLVNEYFGRSGVKRVSFLTAGIILFGFVFIYIGTSLPGSDFWLQLNNKDGHGQPFDIDFAYQSIFRQSGGIIVGSVTAFLISQMVDAYTFHSLRVITGHKKLWLRATGSTIVSQLIDSFIVLFIAFYVFGNWSMTQVLSVGVVQYFYKIILAIALTPVIYLAHNYIDRYLGDEHPNVNAAGEDNEKTAA